MQKYPKINSLYKRDLETKKLIVGDYADDVYDTIRSWDVKEKIDGTNVRISYSNGVVEYGGRTDKAVLPPNLLVYLREKITAEKLHDCFKSPENEADIMLFGEGYGGKIQAGSYYSENERFALFDVKIGKWWLQYEDIKDIAEALNVSVVPLLGERWLLREIQDYVYRRPPSVLAEKEHEMEGIVAYPNPMLLDRQGRLIRFKLKCKDYER